MISQLQMHHIYGIFHFGEKTFTVICSAKHVHYLLGVGDKVGESSRQKHMDHIEIEAVTGKKSS